MFNMLIVEDELIQAQHLVNCICKKFSNIRLYGIASTGKEAIQIIKEEKIDIIILDLKLPDISGKKIISYIEEHNLIKYKNSIIVVSGFLNFSEIALHNPYIFSFIFKGSSIDIIINDISILISSKTNEVQTDFIKKKISKQLRDLNFKFSYVGTKYLSDCIYETYCLYNKSTINLEKCIYPIIAKKYNKSISNIKSSINKSVNLMYYDCDEQILKQFLKIKILTSNPKPKDIITTIVENLKN